MTPIPPEEVGKTVAEFCATHPLAALKITTHFGSTELPVSEIWGTDDTLHISVNEITPEITTPEIVIHHV